MHKGHNNTLRSYTKTFHITAFSSFFYTFSSGVKKIMDYSKFAMKIEDVIKD